MKKEKNTQGALKRKLVKNTLPMAMALVPLTTLPNEAHAMVSIIVSATIDLHFGDITVDAGLGGTVVIPTVGARSQTGGVNLIGGAGLESPATLSISGSTGLLMDVTMVGGPFTVDDTGGGAPMSVNAFDINGGGSATSLTLTTNPGTFPIGATLNVAAGQAAGIYTGSYSVMVNYQ